LQRRFIAKQLLDVAIIIMPMLYCIIAFMVFYPLQNLIFHLHAVLCYLLATNDYILAVVLVRSYMNFNFSSLEY